MRFLAKNIKLVFRALGIIVSLVSVYTLVAGAICLWSFFATKDSEGFISTWTLHINKASHAIVLRPDDIDIGGGFSMCDTTMARDGDTSIKLEALNNNTSNQIFVGLATDADLDNYLSGVGYDEIEDLRIIPNRADYNNYPGDIKPESPILQSFWIESTYGTGTQHLTCAPRTEPYALVFMNEDGSAGIDIHLVVKSKVALLFTTGMINTIVGVFLLLVGLMILLSKFKLVNKLYPEPQILQKRRMEIMNA